MILVVCLNPALQRMLWFDELYFAEVNRARKVAIGLGGKGLNVARVLTQLESRCLVILPLGGYSGSLCKQLLNDEGIHYEDLETLCPTRICTTLVHKNQQTELVEEGGPVSPKEFEKLYDRYEKYLAYSDMVIISGSAPEGIPDQIYYQMVALATKKGIKCIIDAQKQALLQGLAARPWLAKPNLKELITAMAGRTESNLSLKKRLQWLLEMGAQYALVTHGSKGAYFFDGQELYRIYGPPLVPVNAIGSGDALCAGLAAAYKKEKNVLQAIKFGTACAVSNTLTPVSGSIDTQVVKEMFEKVIVKAINY